VGALLGGVRDHVIELRDVANDDGFALDSMPEAIRGELGSAVAPRMEMDRNRQPCPSFAFCSAFCSCSFFDGYQSIIMPPLLHPRTGALTALVRVGAIGAGSAQNQVFPHV
jgi:hypothetical protein